jgi:hypothetical protein
VISFFNAANAVSPPSDKTITATIKKHMATIVRPLGLASINKPSITAPLIIAMPKQSGTAMPIPILSSDH